VFLSLVAFQFVVTQELPKTPYVTVIDEFFFASFFFATSMLISSVLIGSNLPNDADNRHPLVILDRIFFYVYCFFNLVVLFRLYAVNSKFSDTFWILEHPEYRAASQKFYNLPTKFVHSATNPPTQFGGHGDTVKWAKFQPVEGAPTLGGPVSMPKQEGVVGTTP
jgi:hypothetical protein